MIGTRGRPYQRTTAGKGSQLAQALSDNNAKLAKQIYADTTTRFDALYPAGDREWFENWEKKIGVGDRVLTNTHGHGTVVVQPEMVNHASIGQPPLMRAIRRYGVKLDDADKYPWYKDGIAYFYRKELEHA